MDYQDYRFKTPEVDPFPKDLEVHYQAPAMPDFVGPMPMRTLTRGKEYTSNTEWVTNGHYNDQAIASDRAYYRSIGFWPVTTQEVLCCQELHGGQDKMLDVMHKHGVYFYIYDAHEYFQQPAIEKVEYRPVITDDLLGRIQRFEEAFAGAGKLLIDSFSDFTFPNKPLYPQGVALFAEKEVQEDTPPKNRPKGPRRTKNQRGAWWNK